MKNQTGVGRENIKSKAADKIGAESEGLTGTHRFVIYYLCPDLIFHMFYRLAIPTRPVLHVTETGKRRHSSAHPSSFGPTPPSSGVSFSALVSRQADGAQYLT